MDESNYIPKLYTFNIDSVNNEYSLNAENNNSNIMIQLKNKYNNLHIDLNNSNLNFKINESDLFSLNNNTINFYNKKIEGLIINDNVKIIKNSKTYNTSDIPFLIQNKIPKYYINIEDVGNNSFNKVGSKFGIGIKRPIHKLHVKDGNSFIQNGNLLINNTVDYNIINDSILNILGDNSNYNNNDSTIKLSNNNNEPTLKIFANNSLILIGKSICKNNDLIQNLKLNESLNLYVENDIECKKITCKQINIDNTTENYVLNIKGNVKIDGLLTYSYLQKNNDISNITLDNYYNKSEIDNIIHSLDIDTLPSILEDFNRIENDITLIKSKQWLSSNINEMSVNNKKLLINQNISGIRLNSDIVSPVLYVGNFIDNYDILHSGILCEGDIAAYSDSNIKHSIKPLNNCLENLLKLKGIKYKKKDLIGSLNENKEFIGLIAQDVEKVYPELITEFNDKKGIIYGNIVAIIIEAIKELYELIDK
jgi:hypothetical protein